MLPLAFLLAGPKVVPILPLFGATPPQVERALGEGSTLAGSKAPIENRYYRGVSMLIQFVNGRVVRVNRSFDPFAQIGWKEALASVGLSTRGVEVRHKNDFVRETWRITGGSLSKGFEARFVIARTQTKTMGPSLTVASPLAPR